MLSDEPDGIDPTVTNNSFAMYVLVNCFEGLVSYDESGSIVPALAESWDISEDGTVYTFHLREGLKWSDALLAQCAHFDELPLQLGQLFIKPASHYPNLPVM